LANSIQNGQPWLDTKGDRIQAHAGALYYENDTFYWYGENKEYTKGKGKIWTWGIRCYSSKDLYNWEDLGLIIEPDLKNKKSPLHPHRRIDRPHILFCAATGKYVCWLKENGSNAKFHILTADALLGPYTLVRQDVQLMGMVAGDFDMTVDPETGKGYILFCQEWEGVLCMTLTEDYLDVTGEKSICYEGLHPPFCREGITCFHRNDHHYLLTSGMIGYIPNPSQVATFDSWHGPMTEQGNPHVNDDSCASFNSQISQVFKHPHKKDLYIALADRWVPDFVMTRERYDWISTTIASHYDKKYKASLFDFLKLLKTPMMGSANTSLSQYIWLPIRFEGDRLLIDWKEEWQIEDYE